MFPRLYSDQPCPIDGYEGYSFRVLLNPTGAEKDDWAMGNAGVQGCEACADARKAKTPTPFCEQCTLARDRLGRSATVIYGTSHVKGFNFADTAASLATFAMTDLPDELLLWLYLLPGALWAARAEEIKKKLLTSLPTGDFTHNSA